MLLFTFLLGKLRHGDLLKVTQLVKNKVEIWSPVSADPEPVVLPGDTGSEIEQILGLRGEGLGWR